MAGPTDPRPFASPSPGVGRLSHWQIGWLLAFEDTPGIDAHKAIQLRQAVAVCHQTASASEVTQVVDGGMRWRAAPKKQCGRVGPPARLHPWCTD